MCKASVCFLIFVFLACSEYCDFSEMVVQKILDGNLSFPKADGVACHDALTV